MNPLRFRAVVVDYANAVHLLACVDGGDGRLFMYAEPVNLVMVERPSDYYLPAPTLDLPMKTAQSLLDALIEAGLRPTSLANPSGEITRINDHLQDMRRLVFKGEPT